MGSLCSAGDVPSSVNTDSAPKQSKSQQSQKQTVTTTEPTNTSSGQPQYGGGVTAEVPINDVGGETNEDTETFQLEPVRKQAFADYISELNSEKIENFLTRFEFAANPMGPKEVQLLFHALICLYLRKMEKERKLPRDEQTKPFCEELSNHLFEYHKGRTLIRVKSLTQWIEKGELKAIEWN